jgi:hypothetical protein
MNKKIKYNYPKTRIMHGLTKKSFYSCYNMMIHRCTKPHRIDYKYYGGRGIKVCERWLKSAANFYEDMGERPSMEHVLDRIDPDGNYEPTNCRWVTKKINARNTRRSKSHSKEYIKVKKSSLCSLCLIKCKVSPKD